jgi:hypothetical protein
MELIYKWRSDVGKQRQPIQIVPVNKAYDCIRNLSFLRSFWVDAENQEQKFLSDPRSVVLEF